MWVTEKFTSLINSRVLSFLNQKVNNFTCWRHEKSSKMANEEKPYRTSYGMPKSSEFSLNLN
jgi:hypothetical protein